jgi:hypothetical protein
MIEMEDFDEDSVGFPYVSASAYAPPRPTHVSVYPTKSGSFVLAETPKERDRRDQSLREEKKKELEDRRAAADAKSFFSSKVTSSSSSPSAKSRQSSKSSMQSIEDIEDLSEMESPQRERILAGASRDVVSQKLKKLPLHFRPSLSRPEDDAAETEACGRLISKRFGRDL